MEAHDTPRVIIIGAGFGGLQAARALGKEAPAARVLLLDRHNYHTFTPLLYQVATAALEAEEIAYPIRSLIRRYRNIAFRIAEVTQIDLGARLVVTNLGSEAFDYLIAAAGSVTSFFGLHGVEEESLGLKDLPEALELRNRLLLLFERAAEQREDAERRRLLTIAIVGGGPTGVELAGAVSELARQILARDFPAIDSGSMRVILVEAGDRVLSPFRPGLSATALRTLRRRGVEVLLRSEVGRVENGAIYLKSGPPIPAPLLVWAAGVRASDLGRDLAARAGSSGRVPVLPTLQLSDHPEVYVIGDLAELREGGRPLPMLAPVAMQQGRLAGRNVALQLQGRPPRPFHYTDRGIMATLGRSSAIAQVGPLSLSGFLAWLAWLALHLIELIGFRNRLLVLVNWAWDYFFYDRGVRVITAPADVGPPAERLESAD